MIVKLLTEHHLECLNLKGGCRGSPESTLVKMPHCWESHALALLLLFLYYSAHLQIAESDMQPLLEDSIDVEGGHKEGPHLPHQKNINVRAAFIHVIGDIIQSCGVLIAALIIKLKVSTILTLCILMDSSFWFDIINLG